MTDHADNEINTIGGEGKASIQQNKAERNITVKLEPSQHNMLKGSGEFQINTGDRDSGICQVAGTGCVCCPIYSA